MIALNVAGVYETFFRAAPRRRAIRRSSNATGLSKTRVRSIERILSYYHASDPAIGGRLRVRAIPAPVIGAVALGSTAQPESSWRGPIYRVNGVTVQQSCKIRIDRRIS